MPGSREEYLYKLLRDSRAADAVSTIIKAASKTRLGAPACQRF